MQRHLQDFNYDLCGTVFLFLANQRAMEDPWSSASPDIILNNNPIANGATKQNVVWSKEYSRTSKLQVRS